MSVFAIAIAVGGIAFAPPAGSAPNDAELDVGAYDECYAEGLGQGLDDDEFFNHAAVCCMEAGGTWNDKTYACQAPPAQPAELRPGFNLPPGLTLAPDQTLTPVPPPPTLEPSLQPDSRG